MSAEQRGAWQQQRSRPAGANAGAGAGARNSQSRSSTASPNQANAPAKAATSAPAVNVWAEKAQERSGSAAQRAASGTRDGSSGTKDGARKGASDGDGAGGVAAAAASLQVSTANQQQKRVPRPGVSTKELLNFLKQGSAGVPTYKMVVSEDDAKTGNANEAKAQGNNRMANGQDFFTELSKQTAEFKAGNTKQ